MKVQFMNLLEKIMKHNDYPEGSLTVEQCDEINSWTPCDLIAREYLNNGGGSAKGFLGITPEECVDAYNYMCEIKDELIDKHYISERAYNASGCLLWFNWSFD